MSEGNISDELSLEEKTLWVKLRERVLANQQAAHSFIECLTEIRDCRLYREDYKTFEAYVGSELGLSKTHINRLIVHHQVTQDLTPIGVKVTESQAREISKVPPEKRIDVAKKVVQKANDQNRKPTAQDYKEAVEEIQYEDVAAVDEPMETEVHVAKAKQAVANAEIGRKIVAALDQAKKLLTVLKEVPGTEVLVARKKSIMHDLEIVRKAVTVTIPHSICPRCMGDACADCGNMGWVNAALAEE